MRVFKIMVLIGALWIGTASFAAAHSAGSMGKSDCAHKANGSFGDRPAISDDQLAKSLNRESKEDPKTNRPPVVAGSFRDVSS